MRYKSLLLEGLEMKRSFWSAPLIALCLVVSFSAGAEENLAPKEWARLVSSSELPALKAYFNKSLSLNQIPAETGVAAQTLAEKISGSLAGNPDEGELRVQSLRYVALTDLMALSQMQGLCSASGCPNQLKDAIQKNIDLVALLTGDVQESSVAAHLETLKGVERLAEEAQQEILRTKQIEALAPILLRLQALAEAEPSEASRLNGAVSDLRAGMENIRQKKSDAAEADLKRGFAAAFGNKAERWDGRHLYHYLSLRVVALNVARSQQVAEADQKAVLTALGSLSEVNDTDAYDKASATLQASLQTVVEKNKLAVIEPDVALALSPEAVRASLSARLGAMEEWASEAQTFFTDKETVTQWLRYEKRARLLMHLGNIQAKLYSAKLALARANDFRTIRATHHSIAYFQAITSSLMESILERSNAADIYMGVWERGLTRMTEKGESFMTASDYRKVRKALDLECREGVYRAWVNRKNASVAAMSVLLAVEAISIPFTGGGSAAAMPATLSAITTMSVVGAKTVLITNSALNIADRGKIGGLKGLANLDTAFDALVILSLSPRPMIGNAPATTTVGKITQYGAAKLAQFQYSSAAFLGVAGPAYGAYLVFDAETIAKNLQKEGVVVTADEVRRRGLVSVALGMISYGVNRAYYRDGVAKNGKDFEKAIEPGTFVGGTLKQWGKSINQPGTLLKYRADHPGAVGAVMTAGKVAGYALMDYLLFTEAMLLSYTNVDSFYLNHAYSQHELPDLREGETAVVLVGFDPSDYFLWAGAKAMYSHHRESAKYGSNLYLYTYTNPDDLFTVLEKHRKEHGPVRFLKIATHGRPGKLYTREVWGSPEGKAGDGWINYDYLEANQERLQASSREIFAPDSRMLLWACLVGTNQDQESEDGPKNTGDLFLAKLGDVMLVNGGAIDASTRVLLGWDATAGVLGNYLHTEGFRTLTADGKPRLVLPLKPLVEEPGPEVPRDAAGFPVAKLEDRGDDSSPLSINLLANGDQPKADALPASEVPGVLEVGKSMFNRLFTLYTDTPPVWWKYGVNLEGPHWRSGYYKYVEVKAH